MVRFSSYAETVVAVIVLAALPDTRTIAAAMETRQSARLSDSLHHVDHVILGVGDLDAGMVEFERLTGVRPAKGGEHPGRGTQNALVSLGGGTYLEILAPQTNARREGDVASLFAMQQLTAWGWAVRTRDIRASAARLKAAGIATTEPRAGSRKTLAGPMLAWTTVGITTPALTFNPFLIQWGEGTVHPSSSAPAGCSLVRAEAGDSNMVALRALIQALVVPMGFAGEAHASGMAGSSRSSLSFTLLCPAGHVAFRSRH